ncbi:MAG: hypothetical protein ABI679_02005 [Gemmatimonadota bacterium]
MPNFIDYVGLLLPARAEILSVVAGHETLEQVLAWALSQKPPIHIDEILTQDEYTHDVVLPYRDGRYLVYDTT